MSPLPRTASMCEVVPGVRRWEVFSPEHRVVLTSHAVHTPAGWLVFDPIPLEAAAVEQFVRSDGALVLTNGNHERAVREWRERWPVPVWVSRDAGIDVEGTREFDPAELSGAGCTVCDLGGGGPGEVAFRFPALDLVVVGDAVVNLPGRGLEILPDRYCSNPAKLRAGLKELAAASFGALLMAHGEDLLEGASDRLRRLLG